MLTLLRGVRMCVCSWAWGGVRCFRTPSIHSLSFLITILQVSSGIHALPHAAHVLREKLPPHSATAEACQQNPTSIFGSGMGTQLNSDPWDTRFLDGKEGKKLFSSSEKATEKAILPSSGKYSVKVKTGSASAISALRRALPGARVPAKRGPSWEDPTEFCCRQERLASTVHSPRRIPGLLGSASQLILCSAEASFGESG